MSPFIELKTVYYDYARTYHLSERQAFKLLVHPTISTLMGLLRSSRMTFEKITKVNQLLDQLSIDPDEERQRWLQVIRSQAAPYKNISPTLFQEQRRQTIITSVTRKIFNAMPPVVKDWMHPILMKEMAALFVIKQESASLANKEDPYTALVQEYNSDLTAEQLSYQITTLKEIATNVLSRADTSRQQSPLADARFTVKNGMSMTWRMADQMGIPRDKMSLCHSEAPAALGSAQAVWIANNFKDLAMEVIGNSAHELGHGHHKINLPSEISSPFSRYLGTAHDEGMAYFWEHCIIKSPSGAQYTATMAKELGYDAGLWSVDNIMQYNQTCNITTKRLACCDLGNLLHLIALTEVERDIINGKESPMDYHRLWREQLKTVAGIEVSQDNYDYALNFQPFAGLIGNFPGYFGGYAFASMASTKAREVIPAFEDHIATGEWHPIANWLTQEFHSHGSELMQKDLYRRCFGQDLSYKPLERVFTERFNF